MMKVPFENISKLYRWKTSGSHELVDSAQFLDGIEEYHFGGTCYSNNYYLYQLLTSLNYDVVLCGADMSKPDVHIVNIVRVGGKEYIVDVGYAAPFLKPLPRDLSSNHVVSFGTDRYVLSPRDATGRSQLKLYRDGVAHHGYLVNPTPRRIEEFNHIIADSFSPDATFMNAVLLVRFDTDHSTILHNMTYIESRESTLQKSPLKTSEDPICAIEEHFSIPTFISRVALDCLSMRHDAWN